MHVSEAQRVKPIKDEYRRLKRKRLVMAVCTRVR